MPRNIHTSASKKAGQAQPQESNRREAVVADRILVRGRIDADGNGETTTIKISDSTPKRW